jgi:ABC-2 type transport system ATP-binding protein
MRRRLGIAQVLVHDPELIILDEPANGLDPKGVQEVRSIIKNLNREGKTVFMSSHNLPEVAEISDRVIFLKKGKILEDFQMNALTNRMSSNIIEIRLIRELTLQEKKFLENVPEINDIQYNHNVLVKYQGGIEKTHEILADLIRNRFPIYSFQPRIQTLEDIYLQLFKKEVA